MTLSSYLCVLLMQLVLPYELVRLLPVAVGEENLVETRVALAVDKVHKLLDAEERLVGVGFAAEKEKKRVIKMLMVMKVMQLLTISQGQHISC